MWLCTILRPGILHFFFRPYFPFALQGKALIPNCTWGQVFSLHWRLMIMIFFCHSSCCSTNSFVSQPNDNFPSQLTRSFWMKLESISWLNSQCSWEGQKVRFFSVRSICNVCLSSEPIWSITLLWEGGWRRRKYDANWRVKEGIYEIMNIKSRSFPEIY